MPALPKLANTKPYIELRIYKALAERQRKESEEHEPGIMLSQIGDCPRNLWAGLHGIPEESEPSGQALAIFALGKVIEEHVIELLRDAGLIVSARGEDGRQHAIRENEGRVRGRIDAKILLGKSRLEEALLEVKSAKAERFAELVTAGSYEAWSPRYHDTLQAYLGYLGMRHALVIVYSKDDSRIYAEKIAFDPSHFERVKLRVAYVLDAEEPVARPEEATSHGCSYCKWCSRAGWCWSPLSEVRFDP